MSLARRPSGTAVADAVAKLRAWAADPVLFAREVFANYWDQSGESLDAWQVRGLSNLIQDRRPRHAWQACKGPGKTATEAMALWWFCGCHPQSKSVAASITKSNLKDNLWTELALWQGRAPYLAENFTWSAERITADEAPETWWISARAWDRAATADQQASTMDGLHGRFVMVVLDESGGMPLSVVDAAEGILATSKPGHRHLLLIAGNPTHLTGPLHRAVTKERESWCCLAITGDPDAPDRAPRVSADWARDMIRRYGRNSNLVRIQVLGLFPHGQPDALVSLADFEDAINRFPALNRRGRPRLGVDVARQGDDRTVFAIMDGDVLVHLEEHPEMTRTTWVAGRTRELAEEWGIESEDCRVDDTGVGGGVTDSLLAADFPVTPVNVGEGAMSEDDQDPDRATAARFVNLRAELAWQLAERFKTGRIAIDPAIREHNTLLAECTTLTWGFDGRQKIKIESKQAYKRRTKRSPDDFDATMLAAADLDAMTPGFLGWIADQVAALDRAEAEAEEQEMED